MKKRTRITLASAILAALAATALVAGVAFAEQSKTAVKPVPTQAAVVGGEQGTGEVAGTEAPETSEVKDAKDAEANDAQIGEQVEDGKTDATEVKGAEESKGSEADTDTVQHEANGQESGENAQ